MMNRIVSLLIFQIIAGFSLLAQPVTDQLQTVPQDTEDPAVQIAEEIRVSDLHELIFTLASDDFQGRETGTDGNNKAAAYIADQFKEAGIPPCPATGSYFQEVMFSRLGWEETQLTIDGVEFNHMRDFLVHPQYFPLDSLNLNTDEVIFLGYGIDDEKYSDYRGNDVEGKVILIYNGEPRDSDGNSLLTGNSDASQWSRGLQMKLETARKNNVGTVLVLQDRIKEKAARMLRFILGGMTVMGEGREYDAAYPPYIELAPGTAEALMGKKKKKVIKARDKIAKKGKLKSVKISTDLKATLYKEHVITPGQNVLAYIEGSDPELKDELVIITAHYDHLGKRGDDTFYGADDNASGTSGVIEIARAFQEATIRGIGPKRSVLCMLVTGEEKGLLGSQYYSENPLFPLENTIANVNIDMIGRVDDKHENPYYTYVIGADRLSQDLHDINEAVNAQYTQLELDYTYNAEDDPNQFYYRSDHYNFAKHGIPAIFYFSGVHEDYHRPSDTPDKIIFDKTEKIARLAFHTAWELANREERIRLKG